MIVIDKYFYHERMVSLFQTPSVVVPLWLFIHENSCAVHSVPFGQLMAASAEMGGAHGMEEFVRSQGGSSHIHARREIQPIFTVR